MDVLLDSNFVISCIKKKIDFVAQLEDQGFKVYLPLEVYQEMKDLKNDSNHDDRVAIEIALKMFEDHALPKIRLGKNSVDHGLIEKGKNGYFIATLDSAIKNIVPHRVVIFSAQNRVGAE